MGTVTRKVAALATAHLVVAMAVALGGRWTASEAGDLSTIAVLAGVFAIVGLFPMHLELSRHACTVTLTEAVLVVALFQVSPAGVVLAAAAGEAIACALQRQRPGKVAFNTAAVLGPVALAAQLFEWLGVRDAASPAAWATALAAAAVYAVVNHASTSAVISITARQHIGRIFLASVATAATATVVSASLGLCVLALAEVTPAAPLLVIPLILAVGLATRSLAVQRAEHLRFERLYEASSRTSGLQGFEDALATLAAEARSLVTGSAAICCAPDRSGVWRGVVIDDTGAVAADPAAVRAVRQLSGRAEVEFSEGAVPKVLRPHLPASRSVVVASTAPDSDAPAVLAVFREIDVAGPDTSRSDVLAAFAGHCALTVANARLYEEVEDSLRQQLDVNRQKDDFVAAVSHELKTPLTSMLGALSTLRRLTTRLTDEQRERLVEVAERQGQRLHRLIDDLLTVAAAEDEHVACNSESVRLLEFLGELADDLHAATEAVIAVHVEPDTLIVRTDALKLRQLVANLVENASKYAPGSEIDVLASAVSGGVAICVVDHGPGIPEPDRERVFERFVQLDQSSTRTKGGTGLGLYLCRQLARILGGGLTLEETTGGGCTFVLALPSGLGGVRPSSPIRVVATGGDEVHHEQQEDEAGLAASITGEDR